MSWYALFVVTGKEEYVSDWLKVCFADGEIRTLIPKRRLIERRQGKRHLVLKKLFPGYLLVKMEMDPTKYCMLKRLPYLIRILHSGEYYTKIPRMEMNGLLRLLGGGDIVEFSQVYLTGSKLIAKSGPLVGMEDLVYAVDKRKMRAKIMIPFMGSTREIEVGIEIVNQFSRATNEEILSAGG